MKTKILTSAAILSVLLLAACGSSGGGVIADPPSSGGGGNQPGGGGNQPGGGGNQPGGGGNQPGGGGNQPGGGGNQPGGGGNQPGGGGNQPGGGDEPPTAAEISAAKTFDIADWTVEGVTITNFTIDGQDAKNGYNFSTVPEGSLDRNKSFELGYNAGGDAGSESGKLHIYNQQYSVVFGTEVTQSTDDEWEVTQLFDAASVEGLNTKQNAITALVEQDVSAIYTGKAFTKDDDGQLEYTVNFGAKTGSGNITGIAAAGTIQLQQADFINVDGSPAIFGNAKVANLPTEDFNYLLGFFGPKAEEIVGSVDLVDDEDGGQAVLFGGQRGDLTPN